MSVTNTKNKGELVRQPAKHWRMKSAVLAVAILAGGLSVSAQAMVLGQIRIKSSLGEPVKAEIPVTKLSSDEATSLTIKLAAGDDFTGRGLVYSSTVRDMHFEFKVTGGSTGVIVITGKKPVQDPFVDLLLDVAWRTGSVQRSYTMLFDPADEVMEQAVYGSPAVADSTVSELPSSGSYEPGASHTGVAVETERRADGSLHTRIGATKPSDIVEPKGIQAREEKGNKSTEIKTNQTEREPVQHASSYTSEYSVTVGKGQTLGQIASSMRPAGVTQEQMLIALFRANPNAFIGGNINWLRAGVTLNIPSESEIAEISQKEARREVSKHAKRFNERRLNVATKDVTTVSPKGEDSGRTTTGTVQNDPKQGASAEKREVLVIESANSEQTQSDQHAAEQSQVDNANNTIGEHRSLNEEIKETGQLVPGNDDINIANAGTQTPSTEIDNGTVVNDGGQIVIDPTDNSAGVISDDTGVNNVPVDSGPTTEPLVGGDDTLTEGDQGFSTHDTTTTTPQDTTVVPPENTVTPPQDTTDVPPKGNVTPPAEEGGSTSTTPAPTEKSLVETLLENPLIPVGALVGFILVLFVLLKVLRRRKEDSYVEDSTMDSTINDSFFADNTDDGSSMLDQSSSIYAASQLDTNADVDPLQEADVYLAYGRDEQAAEILRDAIQSEPDRAALHVKLCEIYVKQGDQTQFDAEVNKLRQITGGAGDDWARVEKMMQEMSGEDSVQNSRSDSGAVDGFAANFAPPPAKAEPAQQSAAPAKASVLPDLEMSDVSLDFNDANARSTAPSFSVSDPVSEIPDEEEGPSTRLALAEEFLAIGNKGDAKEIVEEVLEEDLSFDMKERAQDLLNKASS